MPRRSATEEAKVVERIVMTSPDDRDPDGRESKLSRLQVVGYTLTLLTALAVGGWVWYLIGGRRAVEAYTVTAVIAAVVMLLKGRKR